MIRVKVDIVPYGLEDASEQIGELVLANVADLGLGKCAYDAVLQVVNREPVAVSGIHHFRQDGFWVLIQKILASENKFPVSSEEMGRAGSCQRLAKRLTNVQTETGS